MKWVLWLVFLGQVGCLKIVPKDEAPADSSVPVRVEFIEGSGVGLYSVNLVGVRKVSRVTRVVDGVTTEVGVRDGEVLVDRDLAHTTQITYFVIDEQGESFVVPVQTPEDLVLAGSVDLRSLGDDVLGKTYSRIFFEKADVTLGGQSFTLRARDILISDSRVHSFHGGRAEWAAAGLVGGSLRFDAETVSGDVSLSLNGQVYCIPQRIEPVCRGWRYCLSHPIKLNLRTLEVRGNMRCNFDQVAGAGALKISAVNRSSLMVRSLEGNSGSYCQIDGASEVCAVP